MDADQGFSNPSTHDSFEEVLGRRLSRRTVMAGGLATAALTFLGANQAAADGTSGRGGDDHDRRNDRRPDGTPRIEFTSIARNPGGPWPTIAPEYDFSVLIPWREKLDGSGTSYPYGLTSAEQAMSIGIGHDGMWYFGDDDSGLLCINHEFGGLPHVLGTGRTAPADLEEVRRMQHAHGVSVVKLKRTRQGWKLAADKRNRRIHVNSPVAFSGPAASSALLVNAAGNPMLGTVNNCANGVTPWGTYLTCEENFNGYFGRTVAGTNTQEQNRYGFAAAGFGYGWHLFDPRFDLSNAAYANESNRFGWVVEIDPNSPKVAPVKRTALGRVKHEGATVVEGRGGRAVVYTGDDERFEYIYKFVSSKNWKAMRAKGKSPLDEGTLYVAKFDDDGTGQWLELSPNHPALAGRAMDWILVNTRLAGDLVGATRMDRPEWITRGADGQMYCTLTNNTQRGTVGTIPGTDPAAPRPGATPANPLAPNPDGHIIRWLDSDDHTGTSFTWDIFLLSKDVVDAEGQMYGSPDGLWGDPDGRLFIETDGAQPGGANDQLLVANTLTGEVRRLFTGVKSCEVTGIAVTPDRRTMFVNLQHPGDGNPALTNFPEPFTGASGPIPRDATIVITRKDGKRIGR